MFTPNGKFTWFELMTSDVKAAGKFYSDVVGWSTHDMSGAEGMQYTTFNIGDVGMAGMLHLTGHTAWIGYISVDDVDAHIEKIVEAGGKLWKPATDVPGMLRFAVMSDPQGAPIAVFTPNPAMPSPQRPAPPTPGTIGWHELYTTDIDAGFDFYNKIFGWTKLTDMDMGPMGVYRIFNDGDDTKPMGAGGMMTKDPKIPDPVWGFYFQVDGINAAIERINAAGGKVLMGPHQVPGDSWIVMAEDQQGAKFNLVSLKQ